MDSGKRLLVTGATGFIGFKVLLDALTMGWHVSFTARTTAKLDSVLQSPYIKPFASQIEPVLVPNVLLAGAYREALSNVTHVVHSATPLPFPTDNPKRDIIEPALQGTMTLLHDAVQAAQLRRIVITSSLVANLPYPPPDFPVKADDRVSDPTPEQLVGELDFFTAYRFSKILCLNAVDRFRNETQTQFDVVNVIPGFVHGANLLATQETVLRGSNRLLLLTLLGQQLPSSRLAGAAHIDDVAEVHIRALDEAVVPRHSRLDLAISREVNYNNAWDIVRTRFPEAVQTGKLKQGGQPSLCVNYDISDTILRCGIQPKTYMQMVEDTVSQYLRFETDVNV